jgi:hypothetical protein
VRGGEAAGGAPTQRGEGQTGERLSITFRVRVARERESELTRPRACGAQKSERILELAQRLGMADDREDQMRKQLREQA